MNGWPVRILVFDGDKPLTPATRSGILLGVMGMTGFDRGGRRRLQAEPPSLVKGATALTANTNKLAQRGNMLAMAA